MKKLFLSFLMMLAMLPLAAANKYDNSDTLVVSRDGTGEFRTIDEAIQVCRAFMEYTKVIYVKKGVYKEKLIISSSHHGSPTSRFAEKTATRLSSPGMTMPIS